MSTPCPGSPSQTVVLIGLEPGFRNRLEAWYRNQGWQVFCAANGPEGRRLARRLNAGYVVVSPRLPCESGWLTCAKIKMDLSPPLVIMALEKRSLDDCNRARFLGIRISYPSDNGFHGFGLAT